MHVVFEPHLRLQENIIFPLRRLFLKTLKVNEYRIGRTLLTSSDNIESLALEQRLMIVVLDMQA